MKYPYNPPLCSSSSSSSKNTIVVPLATLDQGAGLDDWEDSGTTACVVMIIPAAIAIVTLTRFSGRLIFVDYRRLF